MGEQKGPEYYDALWPRLVKTIGDDSPWQSLWEAIADEIQRKRVQCVIDVGCGCGHLAKILYGRREAGMACVMEYIGVDFSEFAIEHCRGLGLPDEFKFEVWDVLERGLPMPEHHSGPSTGYVFCEILEHVDDDLSLMEAVPQGARIMLTVPTFGDPAHVRHFDRAGMVAKRYKEFFSPVFWKVCSLLPNHFIMTGLRDESSPSTRTPMKVIESGITLYMIVKDEEVGIERALRSCKDLVADTVVLVDTATTDETERGASRLGARIFPYVWCKDFADARNTALSHVETKWGLVLDGHERLSGDLNQLRRAIHEHPDAGSFLIEVVMEDGKKHLDPHRFHRVDGSKWVNPRHNYLVVDGPVFEIHGVRIIHDRYTGQSMESREARSRQRDEELVVGFNEDIRKNPTDTRSMYYLAQQHRDAGRWEAAYYWYDRYTRTDGGSQWPEEMCLAHYNAGRCAIALMDYSVALRHGKKSSEIGARAEGWALRGDAHYRIKQYVRALSAYRKAASCDPPPSARLPVDLDLYRNGWRVLDQIAMCYWHLKMCEEGADVCRSLLGMKSLPARERKRIRDNLKWHEKRMSET